MENNFELLKIEDKNKQEELIVVLNIIDKAQLEIEKISKSIEDYKTNLQNEMAKYDILNLETDNFKISRVLESKRISLDSKSVKENYPEIYEKYSKESTVKEHLRVTKKKIKEVN
ncbi:hypothetical protein [Streptobacillus moniliformis]|uniref:hypothetical protein n=1 Tax=Streptobacillus moniliformis TaxID=34105 RepID=UPI0007E32532|nr:hypothetical protein [Streptobacillus moniliformis]